MGLRWHVLTHSVNTMKHPAGNCDHCGHRLFSHIEGGHFCANCGDDMERSGSQGLTAVVADD